MLLASLPSPATNTLQLGPLELHYYGLLIALGVAAAFSITRRRFEARGGDGELADRVMVWSVALGFLGARTGYVITHTDRFFGADAPLDPWQVIAIWEGGLALYGGLFAGFATAWFLLRDHTPGFHAAVDAAAVAVPVAQALGRWGNYFNQELFGTPSDLPWAVEIEPSRRPEAYADAATFHPTFLYESLWNLVVVWLLLRLERTRTVVRPGSLTMTYVGLYSLGRFGTELLRTDTTFRILGLSRNGIISLLLTLVLLVLVLRRETAPGRDERVAATAGDDWRGRLLPEVAVTDPDEGDADDEPATVTAGEAEQDEPADGDEPT